MKTFKKVFEAAYPGNLGFSEIFKFYEKASKKEQNQMQKIIDKEDWNEYKKIIKKVLGVDLK